MRRYVPSVSAPRISVPMTLPRMTISNVSIGGRNVSSFVSGTQTSKLRAPTILSVNNYNFLDLQSKRFASYTSSSRGRSPPPPLRGAARVRQQSIQRESNLRESERLASERYSDQQQQQQNLGGPVPPVRMVLKDEVVVSIKRDKYSFLRVILPAGIGLGLLVAIFSGKLKLGPETAPKRAERVNVTFDDVLGCDEAKEELEDIVQYLKNPKQYGRLGAKVPAGVLLTGPPGTGKTLLAKAVAGEAGVPFFFASGSDFDEIFVGVGPKRVRDLFEAAASNAPSIVFIDEIDSVGSSRQQNMYRPTRTINQLLATLDGFQERRGVVVIAATNFPEVLDKALTRPGRFDKQVQVSLPDIKGRKEILDLYLKKVKAAADVNSELIARGTVGFSGADLANLVNIAAAKATGRGLSSVTTATIDEAKDDVLMGVHRKSQKANEKDLRVTAYHEAGHALVAIYSKDAHPLHKVTVLARGRSLGHTQQLPEEDRNSSSLAQYRAAIEVSMGGRAAEEIIFGSDGVTSGAASDFKSATRYATAMVTQFGMSEKVGLISIDEQDKKLMSSETKFVVEQEIKAILDKAYENASKILRTHSTELHRLAEALLKHETLNREEVMAVIKGETLPEIFYKGYTHKTTPAVDPSSFPLPNPVPSQ